MLTATKEDKCKLIQKHVSHPLLPLQQGILFHTTIGNVTSNYLNQIVITLPEQVKVKALTSAIQTVINRHDVLRAYIDTIKLEQRIVPELKIKLQRQDLSARGDKKKQLHDWLHHDRTTTFDLTIPPLIRFTLIKFADQDYRFVITHHHILLGGSSAVLMVREILSLYDATVQKKALVLPAPLSYDSCILQLQNKNEAAARDYWQQLLQGFEQPLKFSEIPTGVTSSCIKEIGISFRPQLTKKLNTFAKEQQVTLNMLLQIGWALLLAHYCNTKDIVFGTTREFPRNITKNALGLFLNTLPIRIKLNQQTTVKDIIKLLKTQHRKQVKYMYLPLATIQAQNKLPPGTSLFSSVFDFKRSDPDHVMEEITEHWRPRSGTFHFDTHYPLLLEVFGGEKSVLVKLHYNAAQFNIKFVRQFVHHYQHMLSQLIADPAQKATAIPILTDKENQQLACWNDTYQSYPSDKTVHELFMLQAKKTPNRIAAIFNQQQLTYRALDQQSDALAVYLQEKGVSVGAPVVLCLERSLEMLVGILGILKAGSAYVPIDPHYPQARILTLLQDCGSNIMLSQKALLPSLEDVIEQLSSAIQIFALDSCDDILKSGKKAIKKHNDPQNLVYIIYTSGSTGTPKGVGNRHQALVNRLTWMQKKYQLTPQDRVLQKTSIGFDVSFWEFFWPLTVGAQVVIAPVGVENEVNGLVQLICREEITKIQFIPSMLQVFLETPEAKQCHSLTHVFCIGEPLAPCLAKAFFKTFIKTQLTNLYGPTEAAIDVTHWDCKGTKNIDIVPIGKPIANTQVYVVNVHNQVVTTYMPGELYIGGVPVAQGYWRRPRLTTEKFIHDIFSPDRQSRLYKTGDLVYWLPDGNLLFLGRLDNQIKLRGFRIELGEIEHQLCRYPGVQQGCVTVQGKDINQYLVAYFVAEKTIAVTDIRDHFAAVLPSYMVPDYIQQLECFPLTVHGKVDRLVLQKLQPKRIENVPKIRRGDGLTKTVADCWLKVLKLDKATSLPLDADFFSLGGNSLTAMQVVARLNNELGVNMVVNGLFSRPIFAAFVDYVAELKSKFSEPVQTIQPVRQRPKQISLSFAQERLWFLDQLYPHQTTYQLFVTLKLTGNLQVTALKKAYNALIMRHEILRTTFCSRGGQAVQVIHNKNLSFLNVEDAGNWTSRTVENTIHQLAQTPFDLTKGPLIKAKLLCRKIDEYLLVMSLHHIICDGWSLNLLGKEFTALYTHFVNKEKQQLLAAPRQYADYAIWSRRQFTDVRLAPQLDYWRQQLDALPILDLPLDFSRPRTQSFKGKRVAFKLALSKTNAFKKIAASHNTTVFNTLFSAFVVLLARLSGLRDIVVATPVAGRHYPGSEDIIGLFVNMLVLRSRFENEADFMTLLRANHRMLTQAYTNQDVPFEKLIEHLSPPRDLSRHPLCQVLIVMQNFDIDPISFPRIKTERVFSDNDTMLLADYESAKFDLTLYLQERDGCLDCLIEYDTDLFKATTIKRFIGFYKRLLTAIIDSPQSPVLRLPLLSPQEQKQLLVDWNDTKKDFGATKSIIQLIEMQAKNHPLRPAIIFENQVINYAEFNRKVNQLAHFLQQKNITTNTFVGLFLDRSVEMLVGITAILKTGATYVPLDVSYPQKRIADILGDSQAPFVITSSALKMQLLQSIESIVTTIICLEEEISSIEKCRQENPSSHVKPDDFSYMIYTSGSSGKPKGVINYHRGTLNRLLWMQETFPLSMDDRVLQKTPISFDVSIWEIFWPLIAGSTVVLAEPQMHKDVNYLTDLIVQKKITVMHFVPSMLAAFLQLCSFSQPDKLRQVFVSGEMLTAELQQQFFERFKMVSLCNLYGPTEASIDVTYWKCVQDNNRVPIGRPIANTKIYLVDEDLNLVPVGVKGEICIAGVGLAWGYHQQPQLTQRQFIDNPFDGTTYPKLYRTGDLGRWLPNGTIEYIGRLDRQIKIRGVRVEPAEIEAVLMQHPLIQQAAILPDPTAPNQQLLAYIVVADKQKVPSFQLLYQFLQQRLPSAMLPTSFILLAELPLTVSGKIDWRRLSQLTPQKTLKQSQNDEAKDDLHKKLVNIWAKILNIQAATIGIHQDFFELGGHSLLALKLIAAIQQAFNVDINTKDFFVAPNIAALSQLIKQKLLERAINKCNLTYIKNLNSPLVTLQLQGNKTPLFLFHPVGGTVFCYMPLVSYLRKDQPCYAIEDPGIAACQPLYKSIQEMASDYLQIVKSVQPEGPYMLGGSSFGGTVAVEIAHQLIQAGEQVAFLPLFDTWALFTDDFRSRKHLTTVVQRQFNMLKKRLKTEDVPDPEPWLELNWQRMNLWLNYRPPIVDAKLTLFKAQQLLPEYLPIANPTNHWRPYSTQPVEVHFIPGNHETMHLEPNAQILAERMQHCIDKLTHISDNKTLDNPQIA